MPLLTQFIISSHKSLSIKPITLKAPINNTIWGHNKAHTETKVHIKMHIQAGEHGPLRIRSTHQPYNLGAWFPKKLISGYPLDKFFIWVNAD